MADTHTNVSSGQITNCSLYNDRNEWCVTARFKNLKLFQARGQWLHLFITSTKAHTTKITFLWLMKSSEFKRLLFWRKNTEYCCSPVNKNQKKSTIITIFLIYYSRMYVSCFKAPTTFSEFYHTVKMIDI